RPRAGSRVHRCRAAAGVRFAGRVAAGQRRLAARLAVVPAGARRGGLGDRASAVDAGAASSTHDRCADDPVGEGPLMTDVDHADALEGAEARALAGGPERHRAKAAEQGKIPVRERVARLLDPGSFAEEGLLAGWEQEGLGAEGVV